MVMSYLLAVALDLATVGAVDLERPDGLAIVSNGSRRILAAARLDATNRVKEGSRLGRSGCADEQRDKDGNHPHPLALPKRGTSVGWREGIS